MEEEDHTVSRAKDQPGGQVQRMGEWLPIATAPFDDSIIVLWRDGDRQTYVGWWLGGDGLYEWAFLDETSGRSHKHVEPNAFMKDGGPTHWMPLPAPPTALSHQQPHDQIREGEG